MRLLERDLTTVYLKKRTIKRDDEGVKETIYLPSELEFKMNVQSAGGAIAAQIYGEKLQYMKSCKYQGDKLIPGENEKDGICLYVSKDEEPDYEIVSILPFSTHWNVTLEKRVKS